MTASTATERRDVPDNPEVEADGSTAGTALEPLPDDDVFHLLQTRRRRLVLHYLRGREGPVEMRDVAEQVAAWEHDTTVQALRSKERQRVYIPLYQDHLPKLDDAGVIEYDQSRGIIEPTERIQQLYPYLLLEERVEDDVEATAADEWAESVDAPVDETDEHGAVLEETADAPASGETADESGRDTTAYYGGASLVSTGLVGASWAGLVAIPGVDVAAIVVLLFTLVTLSFDVMG